MSLRSRLRTLGKILADPGIVKMAFEVDAFRAAFEEDDPKHVALLDELERRTGTRSLFRLLPTRLTGKLEDVPDTEQQLAAADLDPLREALARRIGVACVASESNEHIPFPGARVCFIPALSELEVLQHACVLSYSTAERGKRFLQFVPSLVGVAPAVEANPCPN